MRKIKIYPDLYSIIQLTYKQISKNNQFASFPQVQFDDISSLNQIQNHDIKQDQDGDLSATMAYN